MIEFLMVREFVKELKKLQKKYINLEEDLKTFRDILKITLPDRVLGTFQISGIGKEIVIPFYKVKHFRSRDFPKRGVMSGFRIIYTYRTSSICIKECLYREPMNFLYKLLKYCCEILLN